eukprot:jgi/Chlat1/6577/Chrsp45S06041
MHAAPCRSAPCTRVTPALQARHELSSAQLSFSSAASHAARHALSQAGLGSSCKQCAHSKACAQAGVERAEHSFSLPAAEAVLAGGAWLSRRPGGVLAKDSAELLAQRQAPLSASYRMLTWRVASKPSSWHSSVAASSAQWQCSLPPNYPRKCRPLKKQLKQWWTKRPGQGDEDNTDEALCLQELQPASLTSDQPSEALRNKLADTFRSGAIVVPSSTDNIIRIVCESTQKRLICKRLAKLKEDQKLKFALQADCDEDPASCITLERAFRHAIAAGLHPKGWHQLSDGRLAWGDLLSQAKTTGHLDTTAWELHLSHDKHVVLCLEAERVTLRLTKVFDILSAAMQAEFESKGRLNLQEERWARQLTGEQMADLRCVVLPSLEAGVVTGLCKQECLQNDSVWKKLAPDMRKKFEREHAMKLPADLEPFLVVKSPMRVLICPQCAVLSAPGLRPEQPHRARASTTAILEQLLTDLRVVQLARWGPLLFQEEVSGQHELPPALTTKVGFTKATAIKNNATLQSDVLPNLMTRQAFQTCGSAPSKALGGRIRGIWEKATATQASAPGAEPRPDDASAPAKEALHRPQFAKRKTHVPKAPEMNATPASSKLVLGGRKKAVLAKLTANDGPGIIENAEKEVAEHPNSGSVPGSQAAALVAPQAKPKPPRKPSQARVKDGSKKQEAITIMPEGKANTDSLLPATAPAGATSGSNSVASSANPAVGLTGGADSGKKRATPKPNHKTTASTAGERKALEQQQEATEASDHRLWPEGRVADAHTQAAAPLQADATVNKGTPVETAELDILRPDTTGEKTAPTLPVADKPTTQDVPIQDTKAAKRSRGKALYQKADANPTDSEAPKNKRVRAKATDVRAKHAAGKLPNLNLPQLKNFLAKHKRPVSGKKQDLIVRVQEVLTVAI